MLRNFKLLDMKDKIKDILLELQKGYKKKENWAKAEHKLYMLFNENKTEVTTVYEPNDYYNLYDSPPIGGFSKE